MEDKNKLTDEVPKNPQKGSGSMLAAARKQQNRSVEEIADELNLSVTQIRTIELDQSEGLPEPTYVRGYIRSYAKLLGLDAARVLDNYLNPNWQKGSRLDEMPRGIGSASESDRSGFFSPAKVVAVLVLLSIVGFLWLTGNLDGLFGDDQTRTVSTQNSQVASSRSAESLQAVTIPAATVNDLATVTNPEQTANEAGSVDTNSVEPITGVPETGSIPGDPSAVVGDTPASEALAENISPASSVHELTLNFSDTCWVDIRDSDDKRIAFKSYTKGEVLNVSSDIRLNVFLGNAKVVTAIYNGQDYDLSPYREGVFARFSLIE